MMSIIYHIIIIYHTLVDGSIVGIFRRLLGSEEESQYNSRSFIGQQELERKSNLEEIFEGRTAKNAPTE